MKKYLLILLALLPMMLFTACSSDKEEETPNALVGTTWHYFEKKGDVIKEMVVLEFKSNTVVKFINDFNLDKNPTKEDHDEFETNYVLKGNKISLKIEENTIWGEVNGDKMILQEVENGKLVKAEFTKR